MNTPNLSLLESQGSPKVLVPIGTRRVPKLGAGSKILDNMNKTADHAFFNTHNSCNNTRTNLGATPKIKFWKNQRACRSHDRSPMMDTSGDFAFDNSGKYDCTVDRSGSVKMSTKNIRITTKKGRRPRPEGENFEDEIEDWYYCQINKRGKSGADNLNEKKTSTVAEAFLGGVMPKMTWEKQTKLEPGLKSGKYRPKVEKDINYLKEEINKNILDELVLKEIKAKGIPGLSKNNRDNIKRISLES